MSAAGIGRPRRERRRGAGGQSLVEFSLVFPIIMLLIAGFFEIGRAVFAFNTIANAARQGARVAAVNQLADVTECNALWPIDPMPWRIGWGNLLTSGPFFGLVTLWALMVQLCLRPRTNP